MPRSAGISGTVVALVALTAAAAPSHADDPVAGVSLRLHEQVSGRNAWPGGEHWRGRFRVDVTGRTETGARPTSLGLRVGDLAIDVGLRRGRAKRRFLDPQGGVRVTVRGSGGAWHATVVGAWSERGTGVLASRVRGRWFETTAWTARYRGLERADVVIDGVAVPLGLGSVGESVETYLPTDDPCRGGGTRLRADIHGVGVAPSADARAPEIVLLPGGRRWSGRVRGEAVSAGAPPALSYETSAGRVRAVEPSSPRWVALADAESPAPGISVLRLPEGTVWQTTFDVAVQTPAGTHDVAFTADSGAAPPTTLTRSFDADLVPPARVADAQGHVIEIRESGRVWTSGSNVSGELGIGTLRTPVSPVPVFDVADPLAVAAGDGFSLAVDGTGVLWKWGEESRTWADDSGVSTSRPTPERVAAGARFTAVAGGSLVALALDRQGRVWSWGEDGRGPGGPRGTVGRTEPGLVEGVPPAVAIAAGTEDDLFALDAGGAVWAWSADPADAPHRVDGLPAIRTIRAGEGLLAIDGEGGVWAYGRNDWGWLGDGTTEPRDAPVRVSLPRPAVAADSDWDHSAAVLDDGTVWEWPRGEDWNDEPPTLVPVRVPDLDGVVSVVAGAWFTIAVTDDGAAWEWDGLDDEVPESGLPRLADRAYRPGFEPPGYACLDSVNDAKRPRRRSRVRSRR